MYPGQLLTFTCETTGSRTIAWSSEEYVGRGGFQLSFLSIEMVGEMKRSTDGANFENLTMVDPVNLVLESQLHINVLSTFSMFTVTCYNNAHAVNESITVNLSRGKIIIIIIIMILPIVRGRYIILPIYISNAHNITSYIHLYIEAAMLTPSNAV